MSKIKNFETWINEDFASVGVAPAGNVSGMGNVTPPSGTGVYGSNPGSGDAWPALGSPATQRPCSICKRKKCKCKGKGKIKLKKWGSLS